MQKKKPLLVTVNSTHGRLSVSGCMSMHVSFNPHKTLRVRWHHYDPHLQVEKLRHKKVNNLNKATQLIRGRSALLEKVEFLSLILSKEGPGRKIETMLANIC